MYVQFSVMVEPVLVTVKTQQTPNPAAQFPVAVPPLLLHSDEVKQVLNKGLTKIDKSTLPISEATGGGLATTVWKLNNAKQTKEFFLPARCDVLQFLSM